jgi:uncharacterized membrane protein
VGCQAVNGHVDLRKLRAPELFAGTAGIVLLVDTFLPWFEFRTGKLDAWQSFTVVEVPIAAAVAMAFTLVILTLAARTTAAPVAAAVWTTLVGLLASIWVLIRVLAKPGGALEHCYGSWLGLAATVAILVAGWLSMRDERPWRGADVRVPADDLPAPLPPPSAGPDLGDA